MHMYRRLIIAAVAVAVLLAATPAFAQGAGQTQVNTGLGIGLLGGLTFGKLKCDDNDCDEVEAGRGIMAGIFFGGNRDGRAGLMGEISWVTKKVKFDAEDELKFTYVSIPVLLRINTGYRERDKPSLYFLVGPVFDIQIKQEFNGVDDPSDVYRKLELAIAAGAGFEVARIGIEGRYQWALKSVLSTDEAAAEGHPKINLFMVIVKVRLN